MSKMKSKIQPIGDHVAVRRIGESRKSISRLIPPDNSQDKPEKNYASPGFPAASMDN